MGVYIKGIDLPKEIKEAESVDMVIYYNGNRFVKEINPSRFVEIPTPHGRLIDGDELKTLFEGEAELDTYTAFHFLYAIDEAPTILEAEE